MPRASNKKVARAAGTGGGRTYRGRTPWTYFGVIALIVVLGVVGTWTSRDRRLTEINGQGSSAPTVGTQWYEGYAVYICGKFVPAVSHAANPQGITTARLPGVISIQPKVKAAAGKNATLGKFASAAGIKLNAAEVQVAGGKLYQDGNDCEGKPGHVYVKEFAFAGATSGRLYNGSKQQLPKLDPRDVPLRQGSMLTIAFVPSPEASKIPPPPSYVSDNLNKLSTAASTATTTVPATATTTPKSTTTTPKSTTSTTTK